MKTITYKELTEQIDNMILCNEIANKYNLELISGETSFCTYDEDAYNNDAGLKERYKTYEELLDSGDYEEWYEIYQWFIIDKDSARYLGSYTYEIVYYVEELNIYVLAVTHWGTPWSSVYVEVCDNFIVREWKLK